MKCLILAAGYATRLYPLTENFPKPLLEVGNKTILDWLIDDIDTSGEVDEYVVISNHKYAHHFEKWAAEKSQKIPFLFRLHKKKISAENVWTNKKSVSIIRRTS